MLCHIGYCIWLAMLSYCKSTHFLSYKHQHHQKIIQYSDNLTIILARADNPPVPHKEAKDISPDIRHLQTNAWRQADCGRLMSGDLETRLRG